MTASKIGTASCIAALVAATIAAAVPAHAQTSSSETVLSMAVGDTATAKVRVVASASSGRYDRLETTALSIAVRLDAAIDDAAAGRKFLTSELFLGGGEATVEGETVSAFPANAPLKVFATEQVYDIPVVESGSLARDAIASCNEAMSASHPRKVSVPVVWRVTTGRFNFRWTGYDQVAPTDDIVANHDFYADKETSQRQALVVVAVDCAGRAGSETVAIKGVQGDVASVKPIAPADTSKRADIRKVSFEPVKTAEAEIAARPVCDNGMIREIGDAPASYLCLCPGNTLRVSTGANAFSCEKRARRR